ncbi:MAG: FtsH protease activity modulator HflK [Gammaproteobacteria bacterium]|uniref:Protein HflK n=1 Tax=SAR86 cluster bacterium TaxID=2030880 RepID=A0A838YSR7_9GAMM|nr:FtsH protease activity modulator HflK [SAR86 cluster bacterium]
MNWDNQDKDPWGGKNDAPDFDDLLKKFSSVLGAKKATSSNGSGSGGGGNKLSSSRIFLYAFFAFLIVYASQCIYQLDASERAVILRLGKFHEEQSEGLNFRLAGIDDRYVENVSLTRRYTQTNSMLTKDENIVDVTVSAQYRIANLKDFVLNVKDPEGSLRNAIESALRHVVGDNTLDQTLTVGRENIAFDVQNRLQAYLDTYQTGLLVQQVNIEKTDPPQAVKDAFDDVVAAREDKERLQNEAERYALSIVPEARGQAQARIRQAEGYKLEVVANAEGEVARFTNLLEEYSKAPEVTRDRLYLDALQSVLSNSTKVMVDVEGGNNLLYLPLDKIMEENKKQENSRINLRRVDDE